MDRSLSLEEFIVRRRQRPFAAAATPNEARPAADSGWVINNRTQKTAVNPLTRRASRSVMSATI
jgi:hypothetical protein